MRLLTIFIIRMLWDFWNKLPFQKWTCFSWRSYLFITLLYFYLNAVLNIFYYWTSRVCYPINIFLQIEKYTISFFIILLFPSSISNFSSLFPHISLYFLSLTDIFIFVLSLFDKHELSFWGKVLHMVLQLICKVWTKSF